MPRLSLSAVHVANFVFCEDIRQEAGNKVTILGAAAGKLNIPTVPANIKAAFYGELFLSALGAAKISLLVAYDGTQVATIDMNVIVNDVEEPIVVAIPAFPLPVLGPGQITIDLELGGKRRTIFKREVRVQPLTTAASSIVQQQQPSQSPTARKRTRKLP